MDELMSLESLLDYVVICESGDDSPVRLSVTELAAFVRSVKSAHELKDLYEDTHQKMSTLHGEVHMLQDQLHKLKAENEKLKTGYQELAAANRAIHANCCEYIKENESLREQLTAVNRVATDQARRLGTHWAELDRLREQPRTARVEIFLDEIDAAKAGENFLVKESENVIGRVIIYPDVDTSAKQPRVKTVCLFDRNDVLRAAFMLTRDIFNRTQLSTVRALEDAEPQHPPRVTPEDTAKLQAMQEYIDGVGVAVDKLRDRLGIEGEGE